MKPSKFKNDQSPLQPPLLHALNGGVSETPPFWLMRQAGRYLPEYRALRAKKNGFLAMVMDPEAAAEVTMQPIRRFGMNGAILFSDILVIPLAMGQHLEFREGEGPRLDPVRSREEIEALDYMAHQAKLDPIYQTVRNVISALEKEKFNRTSVIGFAGSPWTVALYMIEGGGSKDFHHAKLLAYRQPGLFRTLIDKIVDATVDYLSKQVEAGAQALQLFDSWSGLADARQFQDWVIEPTRRIVAQLKSKYPGTPVIGFPRMAGHHCEPYAAQTGIHALALDSQLCPTWAADNLQIRWPVQGNLDPLCLMAGGPALQNGVETILKNFSGGPFVFNLGHGIHKDTPVSHVEDLVRLIRDFRA